MTRISHNYYRLEGRWPGLDDWYPLAAFYRLADATRTYSNSKEGRFENHDWWKFRNFRIVEIQTKIEEVRDIKFWRF